jgi:hypothetical protein
MAETRHTKRRVGGAPATSTLSGGQGREPGGSASAVPRPPVGAAGRGRAPRRAGGRLLAGLLLLALVGVLGGCASTETEGQASTQALPQQAPEEGAGKESTQNTSVEAAEAAEKTQEEVKEAEEKARAETGEEAEKAKEEAESEAKSPSPATPSQQSSGESTTPIEGPGSHSHKGDAQFCSEHECIGKFEEEQGTIVECADGSYSHAGGIGGACSHHGGEG